MTVRSVHDQGGIVPQAANVPKVAKPSITERVDEALAKATESQVYLKTLGINLADPAPNAKTQELYGPQIAAMFQAQNQLVQTFLQQLTALTNSAQQSQSKAEYMEIKGQMERLSENIRHVSAQPRDPMQQLLDNYTVLESIQERMAKRNGYQTTNISQAGLAGIGIQLQIEQMKAEAEERKMRHDDEVAERTRRWQKEDELGRQQFVLDNKRFEHDVATAEKRSAQFTGILAAIAQGVDFRSLLGGGGQTATSPPAPPPPQRIAAAPSQQVVQPTPAASEEAAPEEEGMPREIQCGTCGQIIVVPSPDAEGVECPSCQAVFDLRQYANRAEIADSMVP